MEIEFDRHFPNYSAYIYKIWAFTYERMNQCPKGLSLLCCALLIRSSAGNLYASLIWTPVVLTPTPLDDRIGYLTSFVSFLSITVFKGNLFSRITCS